LRKKRAPPHVIAGVCRAGGEVETKRHLSKPPPPPSSYRVRGESPPRARCPRNMTDKQAAGGRRRRPRTPDAWRTDAGAPNMCGVRKNGARIRRPGGVTGEKPSQVCGQNARRDGRADGRADDRLARNATRGRAVSRIGRGVAEGSEKKSHDGIRGRRPDGCAQMLPMSHVGCGVRARVVSAPPPRAPRHSVSLVHDDNNILRSADELLSYYIIVVIIIITQPGSQHFRSEISFPSLIRYTYDVATLVYADVRRVRWCPAIQHTIYIRIYDVNNLSCNIL